jgi:hypothetical protein
MKKQSSYLFPLLAAMMVSGASFAQQERTPDQNPKFEQSRAKYMQVADSVNGWHSTTIQDTYRAIDYLADKKEARALRQSYRRELRLERARNGYGWYNDYAYYPSYQGRYYNNYNYNASYYSRPYRNNHFWNAFPLAFGLGWYWR